MDVASEYRYRNPVVGRQDLVIAISQSGETADTLAAMRLARERGAQVLAVTNTMGSQATRDADGTLYTRAGLEVGVAATKTFLCQSRLHVPGRGCAWPSCVVRLAGARLAGFVGAVKQLPHCIDEVLAIAGEQGSRSLSATGRVSSSSTSAVTSACRWRSRARSS